MERIIHFLKLLKTRMISADVFGLAAQLAFFFLLSIFPFLLFLVTLIGYFPVDEAVILNLLEDYAPPEIMTLIEGNLTRILNVQNGGLLSVGIFGTLWSASNGVNAITRAFNRAYDVKASRRFFVSRFIAILLTIAMIIVICVALLLPVFGELIGVYLFSFVGLSDDFIEIWNMSRWIISSVVFFIVFVALYMLAPNKRIKLKHSIGGAFFATVSWQIVSLAFSYYVSSVGNYSATYGSLGTIIVLMLWFYISGIIIITGGVINAVIRKIALEKD